MGISLKLNETQKCSIEIFFSILAFRGFRPFIVLLTPLTARILFDIVYFAKNLDKNLTFCLEMKNSSWEFMLKWEYFFTSFWRIEQRYLVIIWDVFCAENASLNVFICLEMFVVDFSSNFEQKHSLRVPFIDVFYRNNFGLRMTSRTPIYVNFK